MQKQLWVLLMVSLTVAGMSCDRSSSPSVEQGETPISTSDAIVPSVIPQPSPSQQQQSTPSSFQNRCQGEETAFVFAETRDYWLNICGQFTPEFLVAVNKQEPSPLRITITDYNLAQKWFEAANVEYEYVLGFQGQFNGDLFFAITQLKPDRFNKPKYFRELTKQPLLQVQAHLIPPSP